MALASFFSKPRRDGRTPAGGMRAAALVVPPALVSASSTSLDGEGVAGYTVPGKIKGRPTAADENTGEANINPQYFREHTDRVAIDARRFLNSLFVRHGEILISALEVVKGEKIDRDIFCKLQV